MVASMESFSSFGFGLVVSPLYLSLHVSLCACARVYVCACECIHSIRPYAQYVPYNCDITNSTCIPGGLLGWKIRGSLIAEFEKVAFELEPSTTGNPKIGECRTSEGYHVIMVEGRT